MHEAAPANRAHVMKLTAVISVVLVRRSYMADGRLLQPRATNMPACASISALSSRLSPLY